MHNVPKWSDTLKILQQMLRGDEPLGTRLVGVSVVGDDLWGQAYTGRYRVFYYKNY